MKIFHCDHCGSLLFFENVQCLACGHPLAYLPDLGVVGSLEAVGDNLWRSPIPRAEGEPIGFAKTIPSEAFATGRFRSKDPNLLCQSCRLTRIIPDLSKPGNRDSWFALEVAKRRLVYSLLSLGVPLVGKDDDPEHGLTFEFRADPPSPDEPGVMTGHENGVITINIAEADDAKREQHRLQLHEPYRTLLGHFRHEIGHYYWDCLIRNDNRLNAYRNCFGDEREDYGAALRRYYRDGPSLDWPTHFVSAYASSHSWEDWAESWAHYLHMIDTLETATACGLSIAPQRQDPKSSDANQSFFQEMLGRWFPLTYVLNNLNRGLGLKDAYPFVLSTPVITKLEFIDETIREVIAANG